MEEVTGAGDVAASDGASPPVVKMTTEGGNAAAGDRGGAARGRRERSWAAGDERQGGMATRRRQAGRRGRLTSLAAALGGLEAVLIVARSDNSSRPHPPSAAAFVGFPHGGAHARRVVRPATAAPEEAIEAPLKRKETASPPPPLDRLVTNKPPGMRFTARRNMRGPDGLSITFTIPTALMPFRCQVQIGAQGDQLHRVGQPSDLLARRPPPHHRPAFPERRVCVRERGARERRETGTC
uniref:Uncharacterized protein n=1 Tax=Oryza glaberrima TaxID=4538 RepID=I1R2A0_ORYGL